MLTKTLIKAKWYDLFPRGHPGQSTFFIVEFRKRFLQLLAQLRETRNTQRVPKLSCFMLLQHVVYAILCLLPCSTFIRACAERMCVSVCMCVCLQYTLACVAVRHNSMRSIPPMWAWLRDSSKFVWSASYRQVDWWLWLIAIMVGRPSYPLHNSALSCHCLWRFWRFCGQPMINSICFCPWLMSSELPSASVSHPRHHPRHAFMETKRNDKLSTGPSSAVCQLVHK